jgi:pimeloyl-ACP methyl ester carboxylesterase
LTLASHPVGLAEKLDQIQIPVLEIKGDDDRIAHTKQSIRLGKELSNARLVIIPNCGHLPPEECPEVFLKTVRKFVNNLPNRFFS